MKNEEKQAVSDLLSFSLKETYETALEIAKRCDFKAYGLGNYDPTISMGEVLDFADNYSVDCKEAADTLVTQTFENLCDCLEIDLVENDLYMSISIDDACVRLNGFEIESVCEFILALLSKECNLEVLRGVLFEPFGKLIKDQIQDMLEDEILTQDSPFCALLSKEVKEKKA